MATSSEYESFIKGRYREGLISLWESYLRDEYDKEFWQDGKLLEYIVLRGFELERENCVTYPYDVTDKDFNYDKPIEQIDGAVHVDEMHALVECKDYDKAKIKVEPLTKMRNQLARRHGSVFGIFFSATPLTTPAQIQVKFMAPQLIIIWLKEDIDYCIRNGKFIDCMREKYRQAVEHCEYIYPYSEHQEDIRRYIGEPLF